MNSRKRYQDMRQKRHARSLIERCADFLSDRDSNITNHLVRTSAHVERQREDNNMLDHGILNVRAF